MKTKRTIPLLPILSLVCFHITGQTTFYGPTSYFEPSDVPVGFYANGSASFIEDFEDMSLDGGISASSGAILQTGPSPDLMADGVDIDDGAIDGSGTNGSNHFTFSGSVGITYTFDQLKTEAGLVWTDGTSSTAQWTFEAFGAGMVSLGTYGPFQVGDTNNNGQTAEDRFFGVTNPNGIIAIKIYQVSGPMGGLEVDHIQYGGSQPLPVELVKFDAHLKNEQVYLNWNTASEINSMGFEIEKSKDGRAWKLIGFMNGNGTTNEAHEYEYRDSNPFLGMNYYRLKQVDFDGAYEYSKVVAVKYHDPEMIIQVFPNPFAGSQLNFHLTREVQSMRLFDLRGQLIRQQAVNQYIDGNYEWLLPNLPAGVYWLMVNAEGEYWAERVVKK